MRIKYVTMEPEESEPAEIDIEFPDSMFDVATIGGQETMMGPSIGQMLRALAKHLDRNDVMIVSVDSN